MVESTRLESERTGNRTVGSNPTLSAIPRAASAAPGGRLLSAGPLPLPAKDASAVPRATLSIGPVLVGSK